MRSVSLLVLLLTSMLVQPAFGAPPRTLFLDVPSSVKAQVPGDDPAVVRSRLVAVDFKALTPRKSRQATPGKVRFEMNLFPGTAYVAQLESTTNPAQTHYSWAGALEGVAGSQVVFVAGGGALMGSVRTPTESYRIRYVGESGIHVIEEVDTARYPQEAEPVAVPLGEMPAPETPLVKLLDDGTTFDLLVVYTPAARAAAGGTAAIQNLIVLGVAESNQAYANSNMTPRLQLVHMAEIAYTESGNIQTDVNRLRSKTDGYMDSVHTLRETYKADLVKLVGESTAGGCGIAYSIMSGTNNRAFESSAFCYTARSCISPNYTFAHELGHLMGSNHAPGDPTGTGAFSYSFGYKDPGANFRTVMAYDCPNGFCPRVLQFSNPNVTYLGLPTGTQSQNNANSIQNVRSEIANFRQAAAQTTCNGTSGQWNGCRGNGCNVCVEKVKDYPLYYHNHPACSINYICGGQYFQCNSNCPAPTSADLCNGTAGQWNGCRGNGCSVCEELVAAYPRYFINHPACQRNHACGGSYFQCNANCPAPTEADR